MKKDIHPTYYPAAKVICVCGHTFTVGSTSEELHVEICSNCHPFYTGKQKLVDTARRVERFKDLIAKQSNAATDRKGKKAKRAKSEKRKRTVGKVKAEKEETIRKGHN